MKTTLLIPSLALLASAALVAEPEKKPAPEVPKNTIGGKATITIDVNGQKVTREIDLGNVSAGGAKEPVFNGNLIFNGGDVKAGTGTLILNDGATKAKAPLPRRTWLGVATDEVSPELHAQLPLAEGAGLLIRSVTDGSPAAQADLRINDILVKFDDQLVVNSEQLGARPRSNRRGETRGERIHRYDDD